MIFLLLILLNLIVSTTKQTTESEAFIKVTKFIVPSSVRVGEQVRLICNYELSNGELLHAMKFFKDDKEFYRYMPVNRLEDQKLAFPVDGVHVDMIKSNDHEIFLRNINKQSAGYYKCQVSVENTFKSISAVKKMDVRERNLNNNQMDSSLTTIGVGGNSNSIAGLGILSNGNNHNNLIFNRQQQQRHANQKQQQHTFNSKHYPPSVMNQLSMPIQSSVQTKQASSSASASATTIITNNLLLNTVLLTIIFNIIYTF